MKVVKHGLILAQFDFRILTGIVLICLDLFLIEQVIFSVNLYQIRLKKKELGWFTGKILPPPTDSAHIFAYTNKRVIEQISYISS